MYQKMFWRKAYWFIINRRRDYVLIKDFNAFMYYHTLHRGKNFFCCYCLQAFSTEEILKCYVKDFFKINGKQKIVMPKKCEYIKFKIAWKKNKTTVYDLCRFWKYINARR